MNSERLGDANSVKSNDGNVPPTEPVLPFFSLPDMPTTISKWDGRILCSNKAVYQDENVLCAKIDYQDDEHDVERGYQDGGIGSIG